MALLREHPDGLRASRIAQHLEWPVRPMTDLLVGLANRGIIEKVPTRKSLVYKIVRLTDEGATCDNTLVEELVAAAMNVAGYESASARIRTTPSWTSGSLAARARLDSLKRELSVRLSDRSAA